jgi:predicted ribosome quality control (RQC) complex YloA/Tae2 family protein
MQPLRIKDASKLWKVSRSTIYNKLASGELSKNNAGRVDFAEMLRVFGEPMDRQTGHDETAKVDALMSEAVQKAETKDSLHTLKEFQLMSNLEDMKAKLAEVERENQRMRDEAAWYRTHIDGLTQTMKLLEAPKPAEAPPPPKGFWARLFGG